MNGFPEKLTKEIEASLSSVKAGPPSLMMIHLQNLQRKKDEEAKQLADYQEDMRVLEREREKEDKKKKKKDKKKRKKEKKEKKMKEKRRKRDSDSDTSASDSENGEEDELVKASMALERKKLEDIRLKEEERRMRIEAKRRRRVEEESAAMETRDAEVDKERLRKWQESELHSRRLELSEALLSGPISAMRLNDLNAPHERIPLKYLSQHQTMSWELPAPGGGIIFAPLIGVPVGAGADSSDGEW
jgi:septal ring factor EnvC (AmiA/AmiB activator)